MVGYRYSGSHFKETGKGAPGGAGPRGAAIPQSGERQQKAGQRETDEED